MAAYLQQVLDLSGFSAYTQGLNATANATVTSTSPPAAAAPTMPADISGLLTLLLSFSGLREWLKIFVLGGFFESCRRMFSWLYMKVNEGLYINAYFEEDDASYGTWLSFLPSFLDPDQLRPSI